MDSSARINPTSTRICAWAGVVAMMIFFVGFIPFAKFMPPPGPSLSPETILEMFRTNGLGIKVCVVLCLTALALGFAWSGAMAAWTAKIEGGLPVLSFGQLVCAPWSFGGAYIGLICWGVAAFRSDRPIDIVYMLSDMGWFWMIMVTSCSALHAVLMGMAILSDKNADPIFPRWMGYFQIWMGVLQVQGVMMIFFFDGPFAWNGLFCIYIPFIVFNLWIYVGTWGMLRAVRRQLARETLEASNGLA